MKTWGLLVVTLAVCIRQIGGEDFSLALRQPNNIDPCNDNSNLCDVNAVCHGIEDGDNSDDTLDGCYKCVCNFGWVGVGTSCTDIDECSDSTWNFCDDNALCTNTDGCYECTCNPGFVGDGVTCTVAESHHGESCDNGEVCVDSNTECSVGVCECIEYYVYNSGIGTCEFPCSGTYTLYQKRMLTCSGPFIEQLSNIADIDECKEACNSHDNCRSIKHFKQNDRCQLLECDLSTANTVQDNKNNFDTYIRDC